MNFLALKVKIGDNWEYLDLSSSPSFKKSNGLYLFSEAEFGRSTSIKLPTTEHNLRVLSNPNLPVLRGNSMIVKLDARLTIESGEIYGKLAVNKCSENSLECVFVFEVCDILEYINDKSLLEAGVDLDADYSINWNLSNAKLANDPSLANDKIAIIPYLNDCTTTYENTLIFNKLACYYPSLSVPKLIYDILNGVKTNIGSSVNLSHLFDDLSEGNKKDIWMITDKLTKRENSTISFAKSGYTSISSGSGEYGTLEVGEQDTTMTTDTYWSLWNGWGFHSVDTKIWTTNLKKFSITFANNIPAHTVILAFKSNIGGSQYWNLKTNERIFGANQLATIEPGETVNIDLDACGITSAIRGGFCFYDKFHWALDDSSWYNGHFYFTQEYGDGTFSIDATVNTVPLVEEEFDIIPYDDWIFSNNAPEMTVMDLIKSYAYMTGTQFIYDTTGSPDLSTGSLKFVKSKILSTYSIPELSKIESLERKVGDYNKKEVVKFDEKEWIEKTGTTQDKTTYEINNECMDDATNEHTISGDEGAVGTYNSARWTFNGHDYIIIGGQVSWLYRNDMTMEEGDDDEPPTISYESDGITFARSYIFYDWSGGMKYKALGRLDQRTSGAIPVDNYYSDLFNNATKYQVNFPMSVQDYFNIKWSTDFYYGGVRYAWFDLTWDNGIAKIVLQKYTDYLNEYVMISTAADPSNGGSTSGGGYYTVGDTCTINEVPNPGCTFLNWTVEGQVVSTSPSITFTVSEHDDGKMFVAHYDIPSYAISTKEEPGGSGTTTGDGTYLGGDVCTVSAIATPGFVFSGWYENNNFQSASPNYTFTVNSNRNLVAVFEKDIPISVKVNANIPSTVSGSGMYYRGQTATVSATPDQRGQTYVFSHWTYNGVRRGETNPWSFTVAEDCLCTAVFNIKYSIGVAVKDNIGGTVRGGGTYDETESCTIIALPDSGYRFSHWELNGAEVSGSNVVVLSSLGGDRDYVAVFEPDNDITITLDPNIEGGSASGGGVYTLNSTCTLTATPDSGYTFGGWYNGNTLLSSSNPYSFSATTNLFITPRFVRDSFTISASTSPANVAFISGTGNNYYQGDTCTLEAVPYSAYNVFDHWEESGSTVSSSNPYSFTVNSNRTLVAVFTTQSYTITLSSGGHGSVSGGGTFGYGDTCTLSATPDTAYEFDGWYENGNRISTNPNYSFIITGNRTIEGRFTAAQYTITVNTENGSVSGDGTYSYGDTCTLTATPDPGYTFAGFYDGETETQTNPYTFTVEEDKTFDCKFVPSDLFTITLEDNTPGTSVDFDS